MKNIFIYSLLFLVTIAFVSCDRPDCFNENPIFENYEPDSKKYKDELVKELKKVDHSKLTYWLQKYDERKGVESLYFHIQGDELCAILHLSMPHWEKMENLRERKGVGRRGAEFTNLEFKIIKDSITTEFIYETYDRIRD